MNNGMFGVGYVDGTSVVLQLVQLAAASTPGPRFSSVAGYIDAPDDATTGHSIDVAGWSADFAASSGTGIDAVHVWAFPAGGGAPIFLGAAGAAIARPDVATAFGAQFTNAGFQFHATGLPAGSYTVVAYGRSTISGSFSGFCTTSVTVASRPVMSLDLPASGATVPSGFSAGGWAIDLSADPGQNGVDVMHLWAFPTGGAPVFIGAAPVNRARPDVAAIFGPQFASAGFRIPTSPLVPGHYTIVAYAHSAPFDAFTLSQAANVTVRAPGYPIMTIDTPADGVTAREQFLLAGWAIDLDAPSGPGIDVLHVWAFPTDGSPAIFIGQTAPNGQRDDVAAIYGSQFALSGYNLVVSGLPAHTGYQLVVYAHSTVTGTFNLSRVVQVTIAP
jgi:hypothetical protein